MGMLRELRPALVALLLFTALCGVAYPLAVTGAAWLVFSKQSTGSMVSEGGHSLGSDLLGQANSDPRDFWPRPSATAKPYDAGSSSGSNLGPSNPALHKAVKERIAGLRAADPDNRRMLPIDLVTSSASGLDPHISSEAAYFQAPRVARLRGVSLEKVDALVGSLIEGRFLGLFGEPRVNVGRLNRALDRLAQ